MTYTTQADIEAMAERKRFFAWVETQNSNDLIGYEALFAVWKAALAASPVHAELERLKAENERLRQALYDIQMNNMPYRARDAGNYAYNKAKQALQQKGGGDDSGN